MKKIVIAATFAAVTLTAYPAAACDWNRQASAKDPVVAATAPSTTVGQASQSAAAQPTSDHLARRGFKQADRAGYGGWLGQLGPGRRNPAPAGKADSAACHSVRIVAVGLSGRLKTRSR